jgi:septum formation inhibitor-activating ATPase MinD
MARPPDPQATQALIKGAQANVLAIFLARQGNSKDHIRQEISDRFTYDLREKGVTSCTVNK